MIQSKAKATCACEAVSKTDREVLDDGRVIVLLLAMAVKSSKTSNSNRNGIVRVITGK